MSDRARYWQQLMRAWEKSGLSQAEFCRRRRIKAVTFGWWKRKLLPTEKKSRRRVHRGTGRPRGHQDADFVEVAWPGHTLPAGSVDSTSSMAPRNGVTSPSGPHRYEIVLHNGRVIRLPQPFDPTVVSQLIAAVESC